MDTSDLGHQITIRLARELSLSPSQQNEVDRASQSMANQVVTLLAQAKSTGNLDTAMARQIFKDYDKKLQESFTNGQTRMYRTHAAQRLAETETRLMALELNLTQKQLEKLEKINRKSTTKMVTNEADPDMINTDVQKRKDPESIEKTLSKKDKSIKDVLTPDQWALYNQNRPFNQKVLQQRLAALGYK